MNLQCDRTLPTQVNTNITNKVVTVDLSKVGPKNTAEINLPAFPDLAQQLIKVCIIHHYHVIYMLCIAYMYLPVIAYLMHFVTTTI